jgi:RimJ/RimL family protein N-acetyltransferase
VSAGHDALRVEGPRLYLRPLRVEDVGAEYLGWMHDPEVVRYLESRFTTPSLEDLRAYVERKRAAPDALLLAIVMREGDRHVGNVKLEPIDRHHGLGEIGILLGDKSVWGRGVASEAIALLCDHAFQALKLRKLTAGSYADNRASIRAFEKAGFRIEARRRDHYRLDGRLVDAVLLSRFASEAAPLP